MVAAEALLTNWSNCRRCSHLIIASSARSFLQPENVRGRLMGSNALLLAAATVPNAGMLCMSFSLCLIDKETLNI
jgi:hypothetical protein